MGVLPNAARYGEIPRVSLTAVRILHNANGMIDSHERGNEVASFEIIVLRVAFVRSTRPVYLRMITRVEPRSTP